MSVDESLVDLYDEQGTVLGFKKRSQIDRQRDLLAAAFVFVKNKNSQLLLGVIPEDAYRSRQQYVGKLGFPVATFIRRGEKPLAAAQRALRKDLQRGGDMRLLGTGFQRFDDDIARHAWVFVTEQEGPFVPDQYAASSVAWYERQELDDQLTLRSPQFAPSFIRLYKEYKDQL